MTRGLLLVVATLLLLAACISTEPQLADMDAGSGEAKPLQDKPSPAEIPAG